MSDKIVFYTNPMSRGRMVRWMLEETGQPYDTKLIAYGPEMKSEAYLAINPMGKVPALTHGGVVITETAAIITYLADAFPNAKLAPPAGDKARGTYLRWLFYTAGPLEAAFANKALGVSVPDDKRGMVGYGSMDAVISTLDDHFSKHKFVLGDTFSAADVYVASEIGFMMEFGMIEKRKAFVRYVKDATARPAAKRAKEIDDALLPKK